MKLHSEQAMQSIDPATLWSLHYRMTASVIAEIGPRLSALGLEAKELFVLAGIDELPYPADLADTLCIPRPTVTTNLKRLEAAGLVRREIDPSDLRRHRLHVTDAGREVAAAGMEILVGAFGARLARLAPGQQAELKALLEAMV
jgi:DNA-binding MarR family transcriptional regulator